MGRALPILMLGAALLAPTLYRALFYRRWRVLYHNDISALTDRQATADPAPVPSTQLLSTEPLLTYLDDFLTASEIDYLVALGTPLFQRSMITDGKVTTRRTSDSCFLPGSDAVVSRIKQRAASFLGGVAYDGIEAVQLVRYVENQKVDLHYDWHQGTLPVSKKSGKPYNRLASFFIYVNAGCTGGETWFPKVLIASTLQSSGKVRSVEDGQGVAVVPRAGSGVFWMNMDGAGVGDCRTLHAGLPVKSGTKIGMNIWIMRTVE